MKLLRVVPGFDQTVTHRIRRRLVRSKIVEVESRSGQSVLNMVDDRSLDRARVRALICVHEFPHFVLLFGVSLLFSAELRPVQVVLLPSTFLITFALETNARVLSSEALFRHTFLHFLLLLF